LGVSTRGLGALSKKPSADGSKLVEAYDMIAIDIVADPSAPKGFVDGILENKEYIIKDDGIIVECYEGLERALSSLPSKSDERQQLFMEQMEKFLQNLRTK
jgi:3-deoxy-D-arabino-heptulosonate 7-phosphate (DAHP) synthase